MAYSDKCENRTMYWNNHVCVSCSEKFKMPPPGKGFSENCGFSDDGGRHVSEYEDCKNGTYNNGSFLTCQKCSTCTPALNACSPQEDTRCCLKHMDSITGECRDDPRTVDIPHDSMTWIIILVILASLFLFYIMSRRKIKFWRNRVTDTQLFTQAKMVDDIVAPELQVLPLQLLLDDLDVLEELLMLLDPDCRGVKNTRHLAAQCNFSSNWITYAYSKRDSKSPLVALLEAIAARSPEWTVGHLALCLHSIDRNDGVNVLKKLHQLQKV